jgi:ethanolaminephosphotransferase
MQIARQSLFKDIFYNDLLNEETKPKLIGFKYSGSDLSLIYNKITSPFCAYLVEKHIPTWVAPNLITFIGLVCSLIPFTLLMLTFNDIHTPAPRFYAFIQAIGLFTNYILDNCDGKQARKTGTSSVLGMLFDHGCDSITAFVTTMAMARIMHLDNIQWVWSVVLTTLMFFFAILE